METMRALVYDRPSVCSVRDVPMPVCGEDMKRKQERSSNWSDNSLESSRISTLTRVV